ncbi:MAG: DUF4249 family protein, partial [Bacteroidota bacterium]
PFLTEQVFRSDEAKNIDDAYRRGFSTKYERKKCRHEIGNYMRSTTYISFVLLFLLFQMACVDEIDLEAGEGLGRSIFIESKLIKGNPSLVYAEIRRVFDFTAEGREVLNVRTVILENKNGDILRLNNRSRSGLYFTFIDEVATGFSVEVGQAYRMLISTFDEQIFESDWVTLLEAPQLLGARVATTTKTALTNPRLDVYENLPYFDILVDTEVKNYSGEENARFKWEFIQTMRSSAVQGGNYVLREIQDPINLSRFSVGDGTLFPKGEPLLNFPVHDIPMDSRFSEGYNLEIRQQALSKTAYEFYEQANEVLGFTGSLFDSAPGRLTTNFTNITEPEEATFGIFYATTQDTLVLCISPADANFPPVIGSQEAIIAKYEWHLDGFVYQNAPPSWVECE